jgi:hypothetical protein
MMQSPPYDKEKILKKLRLASGLFEFAYLTKRYQLQQKFPELSERELNHRAYAMIERGCK